MFGVEDVSLTDDARGHRGRMDGLDMVEGRGCVTHLVRVALKPAIVYVYSTSLHDQKEDGTKQSTNSSNLGKREKGGFY